MQPRNPGTANCVDCGKPFQPAQSRFRRCSDCQRKFQAGTSAGAPAGGPGRTFSRQLPPGYLAGGYFDEAGHLRPELIVERAKELAGLFGQERMASTQIRRFFGKLRFVERRLDAGLDFAAARSHIDQLVPDAAYAVSRSVAPDVFKQFVERNVELARSDERSFREGFITHFKSIVQFYKYLNPTA